MGNFCCAERKKAKKGEGRPIKTDQRKARNSIRLTSLVLSQPESTRSFSNETKPIQPISPPKPDLVFIEVPSPMEAQEASEGLEDSPQSSTETSLDLSYDLTPASDCILVQRAQLLSLLDQYPEEDHKEQIDSLTQISLLSNSGKGTLYQLIISSAALYVVSETDFREVKRRVKLSDIGMLGIHAESGILVVCVFKQKDHAGNMIFSAKKLEDVLRAIQSVYYAVNQACLHSLSFPTSKLLMDFTLQLTDAQLERDNNPEAQKLGKLFLKNGELGENLIVKTEFVRETEGKKTRLFWVLSDRSIYCTTLHYKVIDRLPLSQISKIEATATGLQLTLGTKVYVYHSVPYLHLVQAAMKDLRRRK